MARPPATVAAPAEPLVADQFWVDTSHPLPGAGGGLPAFAVVDRRDGQTGLMAVQLRRHLPIRPQSLASLGGQNLAIAGIEGMVVPLAYGAAPASGVEEAGFLICTAPTGPPLSATLRPWPEAELLTLALRPASRVLEQLVQRGLTHRGIRVDNVFRVGPGHPITLGCAWATPPAALQPAVAEPPYVAACYPAARGEGTIADDVYALGVLMLTLALGRVPFAGMAEAEITRQKLDLGSMAALVGDHRLGNALADLLRGMLAEDPDHRPPPALLLDPAAARSRRIAARPPPRAPRPIQIGELISWHPRTLAHAIAMQPEAGMEALRTGAVGQWLRRSLGDGALAVRLEEQAGHHRGSDPVEGSAEAETLSLMHAVAILDPLAPLCWDGFNLWPDALGTTLAAMHGAPEPASPNPTPSPPTATPASSASARAGPGNAPLGNAALNGRIARLIAAEGQTAWARMRNDRSDARLPRLDARQLHALLHMPGPGGGFARLAYQLNPSLPCSGPGLEARWVARLADLLPALDAAASREPGVEPIGPTVAAYIAARGDRGLEGAVAQFGSVAGNAGPLAQLRLLAKLQARYHPRPLPALGAWIAARLEPLLAVFQSRPRRAALRPQLLELASSGQLAALMTLLDDGATRRSDERDVQQAVRDLSLIDAVLARLATGGSARAEQARKIGQEVAAGIGLTALATLLMIAALG